MELHATFSFQIRYKDKKNKEGKYYCTRLRIYGNTKLIEQINEILSLKVGISKHSLQPAPNEKTFYLQLTSLEEIRKIVEYIDSSPRSPEWWELTEQYISNPSKDYV
jgi:hypothetical protein